MLRTSILVGFALALSGCPERPGVKKDDSAKARSDQDQSRRTPEDKKKQK